ncbi:glycosyltransferase family A protein [Paraburkholderia phymatum]|uniref:glycosyltransferase family 2 protein n=1 Tax=Paraburkholderia phymatum TaxID=148447 RepID=UPI00316BF238
MATVSILIPAYKPDYLRKAIASAKAQTFTDIEILVGDDNVDGRLREIVEGFDDPRIRHFHHGLRDCRRNSEALWQRATGTYVKWLYDDDMLMPTSVEALVGALQANPDSAMAFHERVIIDSNDNVVQVPQPLLPAGQLARVDRAFLVHNMVAGANNFIGEPSNVMILRDGVDPSSLMAYRGWNFIFLTDVAMYLNLAERAPLTLVGGHLSCFRRHPTQNSSNASPTIAAGYYEWEALVRGEAAAGRMSADSLTRAKEYLTRTYAHAVESLGIKELVPLRRNLNALTESPTADLFTSSQYMADISEVFEMVRARANAA